MSACSPGGREAAPFQGIWESSTWGLRLVIDGGSVEIFEYSAAHCVSVAAGSTRGIAGVLSTDGGVRPGQPDRLILSDAGRTVGFDPIEVLPEACALEPTQDPAAVFDALAATFYEHFVPAVDEGWEARVTALRPDPSADDEALLAALSGLLAPLQRPDVRLAADGLGTWRAIDPMPVDLPAAALSGGGGILMNSPVDGVGYLGLTRLGGFAEDREESERIAGRAVDSVLASSTSLILDLRAADGGAIDHASLIASRFVPVERTVVTLAGRGPNGYADAGMVTVRPDPLGTFVGPVLVLIGPGTIGVAEILASVLGRLDNVTLVGQATSGSPGPGMVRFLPNGWSVGFPNLRVTTSDGIDLTTGVVPDVRSDDALSAAIGMLGG